jgi:hypothetical protein
VNIVRIRNVMDNESPRYKFLFMVGMTISCCMIGLVGVIVVGMVTVIGVVVTLCCMLLSCMVIMLRFMHVTVVLPVNTDRSHYEKGIKKDSNRAKKAIHFVRFSRIRRKSNSQETGSIEVS